MPPLNNRLGTSAAEIRAISGLLSEFCGDDTFWKWERQINYLRNSYGLNDSATKMLISSRLKGKAYEWFHSKPEHIEYNVDELLQCMKDMFDFKRDKLELRHKFKRRKWQSKESFADYMHDKIVLATHRRQGNR